MVYLEISPTETVGATMEVAKGITDFGMLAVTGAFFLVLTALMWVGVFRWFKTIIDGFMTDYKKQMEEIQEEERKQTDVMGRIAEQLAPETLIKIKNFSSAHFDLSAERVCRLIKKVREENHIADKEATRTKIHTLLQNLHDDRNSRFDTFIYRSKPLTAYVNKAWVGWVAEVVEREIYADKVNHARARTNVEAVYERIKLDFYQRMG